MEEYASKLPDIAQKGYAQDSEEYAMGIGCLAVPIFDNAQNPDCRDWTYGTY